MGKQPLPLPFSALRLPRREARLLVTSQQVRRSPTRSLLHRRGIEAGAQWSGRWSSLAA